MQIVLPCLDVTTVNAFFIYLHCSMRSPIEYQRYWSELNKVDDSEDEIEEWHSGDLLNLSEKLLDAGYVDEAEDLFWDAVSKYRYDTESGWLRCRAGSILCH